MDAPALQRVQVCRERRDERLSLAGLHLVDVALVKGGAAHQLNVEVSLPDGSHGGFSNGCERLGHQLVEVLAATQSLAELDGQVGEVLIGTLLHLRLERVDELGDRTEVLELAPFTEAAERVEYGQAVSFPEPRSIVSAASATTNAPV